jgi:hypothetical protein
MNEGSSSSYQGESDGMNLYEAVNRSQTTTDTSRTRNSAMLPRAAALLAYTLMRCSMAAISAAPYRKAIDDVTCERYHGACVLHSGRPLDKAAAEGCGTLNLPHLDPRSHTLEHNTLIAGQSRKNAFKYLPIAPLSQRALHRQRLSVQRTALGCQCSTHAQHGSAAWRRRPHQSRVQP